jgi:hypothetical protein
MLGALHEHQRRPLLQLCCTVVSDALETQHPRRPLCAPVRRHELGVVVREIAALARERARHAVGANALNPVDGLSGKIQERRARDTAQSIVYRISVVGVVTAPTMKTDSTLAINATNSIEKYGSGLSI